LAPEHQEDEEMFDQLVETDSANAGQRSRRAYFLTSSIIVGILFITAVVVSIYAGDYGLGRLDLELTELTTPVELTAPEPEIVKPRPATEQTSIQSERTIRMSDVVENMAAATKIPTGISSAPNTAPTAPVGKFEIGAINRDSSDSGDIGRRPGNSGSENASTEPEVEVVQLAEIADPPPVRRPPVIKSKGVINGEAKSLPVPTYPAIALAAGARGLVRVQVTLDESGKVISASAVDGNPMLRRSAETAARSARFTPTLLSGVPVKVTGVIVYNFSR